MIRFRNIATLVPALVALAVPAVASADFHAVIKDCNDDGKLDGTYLHDDLKRARDNLPTDIAEYTDCRAVISAALRGRGTGGGGGGGGGPAPTGGPGAVGGGNPALSTPSGATAASPADLAALKNESTRSRHGAKPSVSAGGQTISPAATGLNRVASAANRLPLSLLIAILAIAILCAASGIAAGWRLWPSVVRVPLRLFRR